MKGQKGQALVLVVLSLGVGALLLTGTLQFVNTGLRSHVIMERAVTELYAADSAVQDALGQLLNGLMNSLNQSNPNYTYDFTYGSKSYHINLTLPQIPLSQDYAQSSLKHFVVSAEPNWINPGDNGTNYTIRIQTQVWPLTFFEYTLPLGFTYQPNSTYFYGPEPKNNLAYDCQINFTTHQVKLINNSWAAMTIGCGNNYVEVTAEPSPRDPLKSYLVKTTRPSGATHLKWLPYFSSGPSGNSCYVLSARATGSPWGINYLTEMGYQILNYTQTNQTTAAVGVAMYNIVLSAGGVNYKVVVAYDTATGTFKILSYQAV